MRRGIKVDKTFNALNQNFLHQVLFVFEFSSTFVDWVHIITTSSSCQWHTTWFFHFFTWCALGRSFFSASILSCIKALSRGLILLYLTNNFYFVPQRLLASHSSCMHMIFLFSAAVVFTLFGISQISTVVLLDKLLILVRELLILGSLLLIVKLSQRDNLVFILMLMYQYFCTYIYICIDIFAPILLYRYLCINASVPMCTPTLLY